MATKRQIKIVESFIKKETKRLMKEDNFQPLEASQQERTSIYGLAKQIIQNCEILMNECKKDQLTIEGVEAFIQVVNRNMQRIETFSSRKN